MSIPAAGSTVSSRLRTMFPDREVSLRSEDKVRSVKVSGRQQLGIAAAMVLGATACVAGLGSASVLHASNAREQAEIARREAALAAEQQRIAAYRTRVDATAADLARRQDFIEKLVEAHLGADLSHEDLSPQARIDGNPRSLETLQKIEAEQFAFVERLTRYAENRADAAVAAMRKLGVNPRTMLAAARRDSMTGGPLIRLETQRDGSVDPRFVTLGKSLARMDALEGGLARLPQFKPTHVPYVSSSFGYRSDPFTGAAAFHAGLDFPGPMGSAIYSAADGRVTFVGRKAGYGNCIEVTHANGLMTRYGHLSGFSTRVGERVKAGTRIGAMGSTGRSTGPHLHFEVRINDRPVNPRPFLEAAKHEQQESRDNA